MSKYLQTLVLLCLIPISMQAQHVYLTASDEVRAFTDRVQTLYGTTGDSIHTNINLLNYWELSQLFKNAKADIYNAKLTQVDLYDLNKFLYTSSDYNYMPGDNPDFVAPKEDGNYGMYKGTQHLFEHVGYFHFMLQPMAQAFAYYDLDKKFNYNTAAGLYMRGKLGNRFGFALKGAFHYESLPDYYYNFVNRFIAVPGAVPKSIDATSLPNANQPLQYFSLDAHASYDIIPEYLAVSAGYSRFFIGDGIRSLVISDFGAPMPFLSFRTNFWKLEYTNLFLKADNQSFNYGNTGFGENKYIALHYLSANLLPWLNIGLFETVVSVRPSGPELGYFNPMIMYRAMERSLGSPDKMALGLTGKIVIKNHAQLYGQFFLNEFVIKELLANNGYIHNKWGAQVGAKYFNLFAIPNLDIQAEANFIRPYAYQHRSMANFSSANLPIAHPLGAGIQEYIFNVNYRPNAYWTMNARLYYWKQGLDAADSLNYGSNILKNIFNRPSDYGVNMINGTLSTTTIAYLTGAYEWRPNFYLEAGVGYRHQNTVLTEYQDKSIFGFLGFRFQMNRRDLLQF